MMNWGLDLGQIFDPSSFPIAIGSLLKEIDCGEFGFINELHNLALTKNAYETCADKWLLTSHEFPWPKNGPARNLTPSLPRCYLEGKPKALKFYLPHFRPGHYQLPAVDRLRFLMWFPIIADGLRYVLWVDGQVQAQDIRALDESLFPLLKFMALEYNNRSTCDTNSPEPEEWRQLTREIAGLTSLLHSFIASEAIRYTTEAWYIYPGTALCVVIRGNYRCYLRQCEPRQTFSWWRRKTERAVRRWLEDLKESGIDLIEYGKEEKRLLLEEECIRSIRYHFSDSRPADSMLRLATFTYGPNPEDWSFVWELESEDLVGDFWEMIENPTLNMVGSWVD